MDRRQFLGSGTATAASVASELRKLGKGDDAVNILTREQRIAILEAYEGNPCGYELGRFEETIKHAEGIQAAFAGVVYALAGGTGMQSIGAAYANYSEKAMEAAEQGFSGRFMYEYYHGIEKALLAVLEALE